MPWESGFPPEMQALYAASPHGAGDMPYRCRQHSHTRHRAAQLPSPTWREKDTVTAFTVLCHRPVSPRMQIGMVCSTTGPRLILRFLSLTVASCAVNRSPHDHGP